MNCGTKSLWNMRTVWFIPGYLDMLEINVAMRQLFSCVHNGGSDRFRFQIFSNDYNWKNIATTREGKFDFVFQQLVKIHYSSRRLFWVFLEVQIINRLKTDIFFNSNSCKLLRFECFPRISKLPRKSTHVETLQKWEIYETTNFL